MKVEVRKVTCRQSMDDFVRLPRLMYRGVPQYVPDLERDVVAVFAGRVIRDWNFPMSSLSWLIATTSPWGASQAS